MDDVEVNDVDFLIVAEVSLWPVYIRRSNDSGYDCKFFFVNA
jgi:hypothetical protein